MAAGDVYQVDLLYDQDGQKCANVIHVTETVDPGADNENLLALAVKNNLWTGIVQAVMSTSCILQMIRVRRIDPTAGGPTLLAVDEGGDIAQDPFPPGTCVLISLYSDTVSKRGRGRIHLPGIPKNTAAEGMLLETEVINFDAIANALKTVWTQSGGSWEPCIWSTVDVAPHDIKYHKVRSWLHTLRSRRMSS